MLYINGKTRRRRALKFSAYVRPAYTLCAYGLQFPSIESLTDVFHVP